MPLEIHPVTQPDIPKLIEIEFATYANSPSSQILRGRDATNVEHHLRAHRRYNDLLSQPQTNVFYKIVDTERVDRPVANDPLAAGSGEPCPQGEIIGWYRYEVFPQGVSSSLPREYGFEEYPWPVSPPSHLAIVKDYWSSMERDKRSCVGSRPHIHLSLIAIHPSHQRRGAGTLVLEHFCREVDTRYGGLLAFCQASREGRGLYERFGFGVRGVSEFETAGIGVEGVRVLWGMVREGDGGEGGDVWGF
ncbi:hypothetical protein M409DRAFT_21903 [Zasmidium cellare ATCC 36951]|uniref:N-acetyltransferase domain-containing protein n=1 Tax=Zasmidium cellare ATCC 36951 TaxID=1080233 RepID=A0A6A6CPE6_ZASCE|nr:uncharacterized protein M409DRAFT_21903 [Zasmidium cellare ATCC 36951]KAF2167752.1 hypothetical protein M409DRAFT_21903 [Zasmidium cellare ATCC 36951]